jgi:molybdate transport system regulatory protein
MTKKAPNLSPILRLLRPDGLRFGPGKAQLLELIGQTGSITKAGQAMGMSYKRAWGLVEEMNAMFAAPVVLASRGGAGGGGAEVTATGQLVLTHFRALEHILSTTGANHIMGLSDLMRDISKQK